MTDLLVNLVHGFSVALSPMNVFLCLIGALVGTLVGVLPVSGRLPPSRCCCRSRSACRRSVALIMLAGIYYGAQYGGSTTSILVNIPGESIVGGNDTRWPPDGAAGQSGSCACDRCDRLVLRWYCVATVLVAALGAPLTVLALEFRSGRNISR